MGALFTFLLVSVGLSGLAVSPPDGPSAMPTEPWRVLQKDGFCVGMRGFAAEGRKYTLVLRDTLTTQRYSMASVDEQTQSTFEEQDVEVSAAGGFRTNDRGWVGPSMDLDLSGTATSLSVPRSLITTIANAAEISISARSKTVTFSKPDLSPAASALQQCRAAFFRSWGLDQSGFDDIDTPAKSIGNPGIHFGRYVYPREAFRARQQGKVVMLLSVSTEGRVAGCRVIESSSFKILDEQTCAVALARMRFTPAKTKDGQNTTGLFILPVRWTLSR